MLHKIKLTKLIFLALILAFALSQQIEIEASSLSILPEDDIENQEEIQVEEEVEYEAGEVETGINVEGFLDYLTEVPEEYLNTTDLKFVPALKFGAQYVAAQAVLEGVFDDSRHNITRVYSFNNYTSPEAEDYLEEYFENPPVDDYPDDYEGGSEYQFDVEITSIYGPRLRAQYTVIVNLNRGELGTKIIKSFSFKFLLQDTNTVYEVDYLLDYIDAADEGIYQYTRSGYQGGEYLPEAKDYPPTRTQKMSTEVAFKSRYYDKTSHDERLSQNDTVIERLLYLGGNYTYQQAWINNLTHATEGRYEPGENSDVEVDVLTIYVTDIVDSTVNYRFNIKVSDYFQVTNLNYLISYDNATNTASLRSWSASFNTYFFNSG